MESTTKETTVTAYLTTYDGVLCKPCALNTDDLLNNGRNWLGSLTAISADDLWAEACCEECKTALLPA